MNQEILVIKDIELGDLITYEGGGVTEQGYVYSLEAGDYPTGRRNENGDRVWERECYLEVVKNFQLPFDKYDNGRTISYKSVVWNHTKKIKPVGWKEITN